MAILATLAPDRGRPPEMASPAVRSLAFVVSTGRCGSSALSDVLALHPSVLSLSELFSMLGAGALDAGDASSGEFWDLLSRPRPHMTAMLRYRVEPPEVQYPFDGSGAYDREGGVPPVALTTLPRLGPDTDRLLAQLHQFVMTLPRQAMAAQHRAVFAWLARRFGKQVVVERSGGSLQYAHALRAAFPEARFVHLFRDGRRVAASMARHTAFRLWLLAIELAHGRNRATLDDLGERALAGHLAGDEMTGAGTGERLCRLMADLGATGDQMSPPTWRFATLWSATMLAGLKALDSMEPQRVLPVDFDEMLGAPGKWLAEIDAFLQGQAGPCLDEWVSAASQRLQDPNPSWDEGLDRQDRRLLELACRPGMNALARSLASRAGR